MTAVEPPKRYVCMLPLHAHARTSGRPRTSARPCSDPEQAEAPGGPECLLGSAQYQVAAKTTKRRSAYTASNATIAPPWNVLRDTHARAHTHPRTRSERLCARLAGAHAHAHARGPPTVDYRHVRASPGGRRRSRTFCAHRRAQTRTHRKSLTRCSAFFAACPAIVEATQACSWPLLKNKNNV